MNFLCIAGHTYLLSVFYVGRLYIVLNIVLLLQCGAENPLLKDGNTFSFLEHRWNVVTASILRVRGFDF